jgi:hypothetical protein
MKRLRTFAVLIAIVALAGCGLAARRGGSGVTLTVTRGFGAESVHTVTRGRVTRAETVMSLLEGAVPVRAGAARGSVESIAGLSAGSSGAAWAYYVNGVAVTTPARSTAVHAGDHVWWDLHDGSTSSARPAVVGSFPEPFIHGVDGKRLPTTLECAADAETACGRVAASLTAAGVPVARQLIGTGSGPDTLGVVVGSWRELSSQLGAGLIAQGPAASGVYARFGGRAGRTLELLDARGRVVRTLGAGAGLIAATRDKVSEPTWFVTGTDMAGVTAAASALTERRLHRHFALVVYAGQDLPVPRSQYLPVRRP